MLTCKHRDLLPCYVPCMLPYYMLIPAKQIQFACGWLCSTSLRSPRSAYMQGKQEWVRRHAVRQLGAIMVFQEVQGKWSRASLWPHKFTFELKRRKEDRSVKFSKMFSSSHTQFEQYFSHFLTFTLCERPASCQQHPAQASHETREWIHMNSLVPSFLLKGEPVLWALHLCSFCICSVTLCIKSLRDCESKLCSFCICSVTLYNEVLWDCESKLGAVQF